MNDRKTLLAVGATGSIGRLVVAQAFEAGYSVRALVRNPKDAQSFPFGVEIAVGDLTRPENLKAALTGVDAIVFTLGTYGGDQEAAKAVDYGAVRNILAALPDRSVRVALMSAIGVTDRKGVHDWKRLGERLLRASRLLYTIIRPGWFDYNKPDQQRIVMLQGDRRQTGTPQDGVISRDQIARVLVQSLSCQGAIRKTFEIVAESGSEPDDLEPVFAMLEPDTAEGLDGACDSANMPLAEEPPFVREDLAVEVVRSRAAGL
ncbi:MAG: SDR family oxidoreductase [Betaproteobacteria bacterium]|nr:SDR family oxidoreductase [Betaproteobacteria bacterium]